MEPLKTATLTIFAVYAQIKSRSVTGTGIIMISWRYLHQVYFSQFFKGDIAIKGIFFLGAHDYKDRIFKLVRIFRNLHGSVGKYINFLIGVTSQQFIAFKFVKICIFPHPPFFSRFHTGYNVDQISRKCRCIFQRHKY